MLNQKKLDTKILQALEGWKIKRHDVANNSNLDISIESATRGFLFIASYNTTKAAIYAVGANSSGACTSGVIATGTSGGGITLTNGTNNINVANTTGAMLSIFHLTT